MRATRAQLSTFSSGRGRGDVSPGKEGSGDVSPGKEGSGDVSSSPAFALPHNVLLLLASGAVVTEDRTLTGTSAPCSVGARMGSWFWRPAGTERALLHGSGSGGGCEGSSRPVSPETDLPVRPAAEISKGPLKVKAQLLGASSGIRSEKQRTRTDFKGFWGLRSFQLQSRLSLL